MSLIIKPIGAGERFATPALIAKGLNIYRKLSWSQGVYAAFLPLWQMTAPIAARMNMIIIITFTPSIEKHINIFLDSIRFNYTWSLLFGWHS